MGKQKKSKKNKNIKNNSNNGEAKKRRGKQNREQLVKYNLTIAKNRSRKFS
jgi:hypothetical protein